MAMTLVTYRSWFSTLVLGNSGVDDRAIRARLFTSSYTPSVGSDTSYNTISGNEVSDSGYSSVLISGANVSVVQSGDTVTYDITTDIVFTASGSNVTAHYLVLHDDGGIGKNLFCYGLLDDTSGGTDVTYNDGETLTITPSASGIYSIVHDT